MIKNIGYEKSKKWAMKSYVKIKDTMCPILQGEMVKFNAIGFKHLIRKVKRRSRREQKFRFSLISYAPKIIADPDVQVTYRRLITVDGRLVQFWGLEKEFGRRKLRVIVRQKGDGLKHFYSIMEHASKNPPKEMF